jgi:hypothetical protein
MRIKLYDRRWSCKAERPRPLALVGLLAFAALVPACTTTASLQDSSGQRSAAGPVLPAQVSATQLARLPMATTFGESPLAPLDPDPFAPETGLVLHPSRTLAVYARPGGPPVAALPATEIRNPTWVPVVQEERGWDRVLLPSRPNRSTGWVYLGSGGLQTAYSPYRILVTLSSYRLAVFDGRRGLGSWTIAVGARGTPTPTGRTFVLASLAPVHPTYSPLIFPLGTHSDTLTTFGGGPGTVGLHGWPDPAVFGHAVSHGCVRVPAAALRVLSRVPLGSAVLILSS